MTGGSSLMVSVEKSQDGETMVTKSSDNNPA